MLQTIKSKSEKHRIVCWQGWQIKMPRRWDPVKLEGDHNEGYALFADSLRPRLGLRWQTPRKPRRWQKTGSVPVFAEMTDKLVRDALRQEVGELAAAEAKPLESPEQQWVCPLLYSEPKPPGRDVFSGFSSTSGRLLQVAYHAHRREQILANVILPTLADLPADRATPWSIFDLSVVIPGEMRLKSQRLNVGDLGLTFADRQHQLTVRQIAVATLALQRQNLDGWIADQQQVHKRYHRGSGQFADTTLTIGNQERQARLSRATRRRRFFLVRSEPRELVTIAAHDESRDRIVILDGTDESLLQVVAATIGQAVLQDEE
jgi:hypothetical protein